MAAGRYRKVSVRRRQGCSVLGTAGPNGPTAGPRWAPQQDGGTLGKTKLRKGKKHCTGSGEKKGKKQLCKHKGQ